MSFYGKNFTYKNVPSELYNLFIGTVDGSGSITSSAGSGIQLYTQDVYKRPKPYFYGVQQTPVLQFSMPIFCPGEISSVTNSIIQKWLFGNMEYNKLEIIQADMEGTYFNCIFSNPEKQMVGNIIRGYIFDVICDAPFGWNYEKTKTINYSSAPVSSSYYFDNMSDNNYYLFPTISFTMNIFGGNVSIVNETDNNRTFEFTGLSNGEVITVNNDLQTITSSLDLTRLSNFNKKWMRFLPGRNSLKITGNISQLNITYQFARKLGG